MRIGAWVTTLREGRTTEQHIIALLVARIFGHTVVPNFHLVTGHLQVLAGINVDVVQMVH
jgi:hypothetical protein